MVDDTTTKGILLSVFRKRDVNGSGSISTADLTDLLQHVGVPTRDITTVLKNVKASSDGLVEYEKIVSWLYDDTPVQASKRITVGDMVPNINLHKGFGPPEMVPLADFCKGKKIILMGLPGAFTPT
eukprot:gnl/MRDRNA2_/MRDRNA2_36121_c0_seq1.p2 gnl/MRDRNA2_/MRDRNA2_36121_c0~~gnl/MRDRNA2_/MRDRNA2_36121_c0_seq1.p2  ORF type:complete len:126 (+),score=23.48 gnl/MRDRNA2_/MRDRNA2_36121_c0_seq1:119-496(+)